MKHFVHLFPSHAHEQRGLTIQGTDVDHTDHECYIAVQYSPHGVKQSYEPDFLFGFY
jgi:hypothetical protein